MKINLLLFFSFFWLCLSCSSQNPLLISPPFSLTVINQIPQFLPTGNGQPNDPDSPLDFYDSKFRVQGSANGIADLQGNLRFFIVDGLIFDSSGEFKDYAFTTDVVTDQDPQTNTYTISYEVNKFIGPETVVVPHPSQCNLYYIFSSYVSQNFIKEEVPEDTINPDPEFDSLSLTSSKPMYSLYDANQGVVIEKGLWYSESTLAGNNPFAGNLSLLTSVNSQNTAAGDGPLTPNYWTGRVSLNGNVGLGATDIQANGSRYIVCYLQNLYLILELKSTGELVYHKRFETNNADASNKSSELELTFDDLNNQWIIATSTNYFGGAIRVTKLSSDMLTLLSDEVINLPFEDNFAEANGIEFSPDKTKILVTYSFPTNIAIAKLCYIDVSTFPSVLITLNSSNPISEQIKYGFIEQFNGNMYITTANGLSELNDPNNPDIANISTMPVFSLPVNLSNTGSLLDFFTMNFYALPDQIDGMDYSLHLTQNLSCCKQNTLFDKNSFTATANATWTGNANPLENNPGNVATIRDVLVIPKGKTVTISNMELRFAPSAKLIIEEGDSQLNGGRLILENGTLLTVDERCSADLMWEGVEIWGNALLAQGTVNGLSKQGRLIMRTNAQIEHAKRAVVVGQFNNLTSTFITVKSGGILDATAAVFRNNQRDVVMRNYSSPTGTNNLTRLNNCQFLITAILKEGLQPITHIDLLGVKGIQITGNDFINTAMQRIGFGVFARNSTFNVNARCTSGTQPCTAFDPNVFENQLFGVNVANSSSATTFSSDRSVFRNNMIGIRANATILASLTNNTFKLFESANQTAGIHLTNSTKYVVEQNDFDILNPIPLPEARTYGIVVSNSGTESNLIYKNTFRNLYIGGQSERINADVNNGNATGLVWKCNEFRNPIASNDLTVLKGSISFNQGFTDPTNPIAALQKAANNQFSLNNEPVALQHDYFLNGASPINYVYTTSSTTVPNSFTTALMNAQQSVSLGNPVLFNATVGCPTLLGKTKIQLTAELAFLNISLTADETTLAQGNTTFLTNTVNSNVNAVIKKIALLSASPYVSDAVLIAYLQQNPPSDHVQQVILANSPVSEAVRQVLETISLPIGVRNTINNAQNGTISERTLVEQNRLFTLDKIYRNIDDQIREVLLDTSISRDFNDLIPILTSRAETFYKELLLNVEIERKNLTAATDMLPNLNGFGRTQELNTIQIGMRASTSPESFLQSNPSDFALLESIVADPENFMCSARAATMLCETTGFESNYSFFVPEAERSTATELIIETDSNGENEQFILYPNPSSEYITISSKSDLTGEITVFNNLGLKVLSANLNNQQTKLDINLLPKGLYHLQVCDEMDHITFNSKFVKE